MSKIKFAGKEIKLPQSKPLRIGLGVLLLLGGIAGFLPILGFWMIPLGLLVLSADLALVRKHRRALQVRWERWRRPETAARRREGDKGGRDTAGA